MNVFDCRTGIGNQQTFAGPYGQPLCISEILLEPCVTGSELIQNTQLECLPPKKVELSDLNSLILTKVFFLQRLEEIHFPQARLMRGLTLHPTREG